MCAADWHAAVHQDAQQEFQDRQRESQFHATTSALTILRYACAFTRPSPFAGFRCNYLAGNLAMFAVIGLQGTAAGNFIYAGT